MKLLPCWAKRQRCCYPHPSDGDEQSNRAVCLCMRLQPPTVQPERSAAKSKAGPSTLRLRHWRGYAQSKRESSQGCTRVKTAIGRLLRPCPFLRYANSASSALASFRSFVSNPSVNQP